jgi:predicted nucleic-acid-binding Zn-ribbon protein
MSKKMKCPKCGETKKIRLMLLDTPENRKKEDKDPEGILLVASKAFDGKMECLKCRHLWDA